MPNRQFKELFTRVLYLAGSTTEGARDKLRELLLAQEWGTLVKLRMVVDIGQGQEEYNLEDYRSREAMVNSLCQNPKLLHDLTVGELRIQKDNMLS